MSAREIAVLIGVCVVWGFHFVVVKLAVSDAPPIFYAALRMSLVAALTAPFLRWRPGRMRTVLAAGVCLGAVNYAFIFSGVHYATASAAAIAIELHVPFATLLSILFLKDRIGLKRLAGIALAFAGVVIIALGKPDGAATAPNLPLGVALIAGGAFSEALGAILVKKAVDFRPIELLAWFAVVGAGGLWALTGVLETGQGAALAESNRMLIVGAAVYSAVGASIVGHTGYYWLLQRLPVSTVAPSVLLTTIVAVVSGVLILGDPFGPRMIVGGLMALTGIGVVLFRNAIKQDIKAPMHEPGASP